MRDLAQRVDGLPLALELLGSYLGASGNRRFASQRERALESAARPEERLAFAQKRLGSHDGQEVTLQETIALSLEDLPQEIVSVFHALGAFAPKPARFDVAAAEAVANADVDTLSLLADRSLLEIGDGESLALHQVLADVAATGTSDECPTRHREYYLGIVDEDSGDWQAIRAIYPQVVFAWQWLREKDGENRAAIAFVDSLSTYQTRQGLWPDRLAWLEQGLSVAEAQNLESDQTRMLNEFGYVYSALGEKQQALDYYNQALALIRAVGDRWGESITRYNMATAQIYMRAC